MGIGMKTSNSDFRYAQSASTCLKDTFCVAQVLEAEFERQYRAKNAVLVQSDMVKIRQK
jgi:hypothetical protein